MIDLPGNWRSTVVLDLHHNLKKTNVDVSLASLIRLMSKKIWPPAAEVAEVEEHIPAEGVERILVEEVDRSLLEVEVQGILAEEVQLLHMGVAGPPS